MRERTLNMGWLPVLLALGLLGGCNDGASGDGDGAAGAGGVGGMIDPGPGPDPSGADCVPDEATWDSTIRPIVARDCGACHGETPQFGAPYGLLDYAPLLVGDVGQRPVDRLAIRIGDGTMPPPAQPQPGGEDRMAVIDWATCGAGADPGVGPNPGGFEVDRPILGAPDAPPAGTDFFELRADSFEVGPNTIDRYECFTFAAPIDEPRMVRRVETIIGDARVLHHTTLIPGGDVRPAGTHSRCSNDMGLSVIYAWAPGQGPLHFEEGGIIIEPGEVLTVQIHYNNAAGHRGVVDRSGVRVHHGPVAGPVVDQITFGPLNFEVPPHGVAEATGRCVIPQETQLIASFPHMHEYGTAFRQTVIRTDGTEEPLITLSGWSFDDQYIYETPMTLYPGDIVVTTCRFENPNDYPVYEGTGTDDEMCFNFAYASPPLPSRYCNVFGGDDDEDDDDDREPAMYAPGQCAPDGASGEDIEFVEAPLVLGEPDATMGGVIAPGRYVVDGFIGHFSTFELGFGTVDADTSDLEAAGQLWVTEDRITIDMLLDVYVSNGLTGFGQDVELSFAGPPLDAGAGDQLAFTTDCSSNDGLEIFGAGYDVQPDGRLRLVFPLIEELTLEFLFSPAP